MTINNASDAQRFSELSEDAKKFLSKLRVIPGATLKSCGRFPIYDEIRTKLVRLPIVNGSFATFISHRWESKVAPDQNNYQYNTLLSAIEDNAFYWYDYSCVPQKINTNEDRQDLEGILKNLNEIVRTSKMIILRRTHDDYFTRGWCFHEWFTSQFTGMFDRGFLSNEPDYSSVHMTQIVEAKHQADELLCGKFSLLENLVFTKVEDRRIVAGLTKSVVHRCQYKISEVCLEMITDTVGNASHSFLKGMSLTVEDIHKRFSRLVLFIKAWTHALQPVEPVSDRIAMFFRKNHWEALIDISGTIAVDLLRLEYRIDLHQKEVSFVERGLRDIYDLCQRKMPEPRYAVVAFLCFFLMGYKL